MNCAGCGAAMKPVGNRNHLQCEHCRRFHFPVATADGLVLTGELSAFACPICTNQPLAAALLEGQPAHSCPVCRGLLTELSTFGYAIASRRSRAKGSINQAEMFDPLELKRQLKCPNCHGQMENYPYAGGGNVVVDSCGPCALIWLDANELKVIANYTPVSSPKSAFVPTRPVAEELGFFDSMVLMSVPFQ